MEGFQGIMPVEFKVLVMPDVVEDKSAGGMYLPESARDRQQYAMDKGIVMAIGEGFFTDKPGPVPKVGDKVIFKKYQGSIMDVMVEGKRRLCRILNDEDICAIVKEG